MLNEAELRRLTQLLGMMGSAHDGEVLNAARLAARHLRERKLTWQQLLHRDRYAEGFAAGHKVGFAEGLEVCNEYPDPPWRIITRPCLDELTDLNEWEAGFLTSILQRDELSEKQRACLRRIARRLR